MAKVDINNVAKRLRGEVRGEVRATAGYMGALALAADVERRFKAPGGGGRATDPDWTEQRLVRLKATTLKRLERLAQHLSAQGKRLSPMQLAALLLERASEDAEQSFDESPARVGSKVHAK
jgi:hypothetical protein